ncbi:MAG TPA: UvrD-helicase domain-containing protein, partial [Gemmataceae bacterium]|nr:UvrD-helicase domain-containing protein [Gemmataceae bacterium]
TFTDRAAREMRDRIRTAIHAELRPETKPADRERWKNHLRNLESAAISTIHSFCGNLLRQYAIPMGLDPRFEILEELLSSNVRDEALRDALQEILTATTESGDDLRGLVPLFGWPITKAAVESLLKSPAPQAWEEWGRRTSDDVADEWLTIRRGLLRDHVRHLVTAEPGIADCLSLLRTYPCESPLLQANVETLLKEMPRLDEAPDLAAAVNRLHEAAKVGRLGRKGWPDETAYDAIKKAFERFRKELPAKLAVFVEEPEKLAEAVAVGQRFVRVAAACDCVYQSRKLQAGVADFQDLLTMARDLLRDRPNIREQVRRRYRFVMIDEFQDTDPVQMELVELLCGPGLKHGSLFAVGDAKQSIYRFRGAEVELFQRLRDSVPADGRQQLTVNFRAQPAILDFVNALFARDIPEYESLIPNRGQINAGPCVEFLWTGRGEKESVQEGRRREAERIARRLAGMIGRGERLVADRKASESRPVRAGDIVLLFRSMSNVGIYEAALRQHGLDYYLVGGRAFFAQQEIYDLLSLLRTLENPRDGVALAGTLRSPFGCLNDETLYFLAQRGDGLWAGLHDDSILDRLSVDERPAAERARRFLDRWRDQKDRLSIAGLLNFVLADCGYDAALRYEFLGDRKLANLWKLIDMARTFDRSGRFGLADFIQRLGELVRSQPREEQAATLPEKADVVRLMSIHQAKGLEFPVVVLPDLAGKTGGTQPPAAVWDSDIGCVSRPPVEEQTRLFSDFGWKVWQVREKLAGWQEDLRILYVACTRVESYLILSGAFPQPFRPGNTAMTVLCKQFDIETGKCLDDAIPVDHRPVIRVIGPEVEVEQYRLSSRRDSVTPLSVTDLPAVGPVTVGPTEMGTQ